MSVNQCRPLIAPALLFILVGCGQQKTAFLPAPTPVRKAPVKRTPAAPEPVRYRLYIPTRQGRLKERIEDNPHLLLTHKARSGPALKWSEEAATEAVKRLLKAAPGKFPPGTKVVGGLYSRGGYPKLSFNRAFANVQWWQEPVRAKAAIYAIVNTAIWTKENIWGTSDCESLTLLVENKPAGKLGSFDFRQRFEPNRSLVHSE